MKRFLVAALWAGSLALAFVVGRVSLDSSLVQNGFRDQSLASGSALGGSQKSLAATVSAPGSSQTRPSSESLLATVRHRIGENPNVSPYSDASSLKVLAEFGRLSYEEAQTAFAQVGDMINSPEFKGVLHSVLVDRMVQFDGPGTIAFIEEHLNMFSSVGQSAKANAIGSWAARDSGAVWDYYRERAGASLGSSEQGMLLHAVFSAMGSESVAGTLEKLRLLEGSERTMAINGWVSGSVWDDSRRSAILAATENMDPNTKQDVRSRIVSMWANMDAEAAATWAMALPEDERKPYIASAANSLMTTNPLRGAAVLVESASPSELPGVYANVVRQLAHRDLNEAGAWLGQQSQGPELDQARAHFVMVVASQDPESAMAWAMAVEAPEIRSKAVGNAYRQWLHADPDAANAALETAELTDEQVQSIRLAANPAENGEISSKVKDHASLR